MLEIPLFITQLITLITDLNQYTSSYAYAQRNKYTEMYALIIFAKCELIFETKNIGLKESFFTSIKIKFFLGSLKSYLFTSNKLLKYFFSS